MRLASIILACALLSSATVAQVRDRSSFEGALDPDEAAITGYEWVRTGRAEAIDGDSIRFNGVNMRLIGIDAPELDQVCWMPNGVPWGCGVAAKVRLQELIDGKPVKCFGIDTDIYGRNLVQCHSVGHNLNYQMLREGWAIVYPTKDAKANRLFASDEKTAKASRAGIWSGTFQKPADYRKSKPRI